MVMVSRGDPRSPGMCTHVFISPILHAVNIGGKVCKNHYILWQNIQQALTPTLKW
jgi:hypothetical protein